jgi:hypothetical protein
LHEGLLRYSQQPFRTGRSRSLAVAPHDLLRAQIEEWNKKLQILEAPAALPHDSGTAASSREKEEAVGAVALALEKLLLIYGQDA